MRVLGGALTHRLTDVSLHRSRSRTFTSHDLMAQVSCVSIFVCRTVSYAESHCVLCNCNSDSAERIRFHTNSISVQLHHSVLSDGRSELVVMDLETEVLVLHRPLESNIYVALIMWTKSCILRMKNGMGSCRARVLFAGYEHLFSRPRGSQLPTYVPFLGLA